MGAIESRMSAGRTASVYSYDGETLGVVISGGGRDIASVNLYLHQLLREIGEAMGQEIITIDKARLPKLDAEGNPPTEFWNHLADLRANAERGGVRAAALTLAYEIAREQQAPDPRIEQVARRIFAVMDLRVTFDNLTAERRQVWLDRAKVFLATEEPT